MSTRRNPDKPRSSASRPAPAVATRAVTPPQTGDRLAPRRIPENVKGLATFEKVLTTAARLLEEVGTQGLTTNLIAAQSGINISAIYKYFPNREAILMRLFEQHNQQRFGAVREVVAELGVSGDWRQQVERALDLIMTTRITTPGSQALRLAMRSTPELAEIDRRANVEVANWLAEHLSRLIDLPEHRLRLVARTLLEAEVALFDWWESPEMACSPESGREIKSLVIAYLGQYVNTPASSPRGG